MSTQARSTKSTSHQLVSAIAAATILAGGISTAAIIAPVATANDHSIMQLENSERVLDTRSEATGIIAGGQAVTIDVSNVPGIMAGQHNVVSLNVTATEALNPGFVTVFKPGESLPSASNLNYSPGETISNHVIATTDTSGMLVAYVHGTTHLVVDITAVHTGSTGIVAAQSSSRALDTRQSGAIPAGGTATVRPADAGVAGAPENPAAWLLNITAVDADQDGFVSAYPAGARRPLASNINYHHGQTIAGLATVSANSNGVVELYAHGKTHLVVDVMGWVTADGTFTAVDGARALDSRHTSQDDENYYDVDVHDVGLPEGDVRGVFVNLVSTESAADGYLTGYRSTAPQPFTSMLNYRAGQTIANSAYIPVSQDGKIRIYSNEFSEVIVDIQGYLKGAPNNDPAPITLSDYSLEDRRFPLDADDVDWMYTTFGEPMWDYQDDEGRHSLGWGDVIFNECHPDFHGEGDNISLDTWVIMGDVLPNTLTTEVPTFIGEHPSAIWEKYPNVEYIDDDDPEEAEHPWYELAMPGSQYTWVVDVETETVINLNTRRNCSQ